MATMDFSANDQMTIPDVTEGLMTNYTQRRPLKNLYNGSRVNPNMNVQSTNLISRKRAMLANNS